MAKILRANPPHSLIFISGSAGGEPPEPVRGATILSTSSCISVACYPEDDGETEITIGAIDDVNPDTPPEFDGMLETPERDVVLSTSGYDVLVRVPISDVYTRIRIWRSHPQWPEKVIIGLG